MNFVGWLFDVSMGGPGPSGHWPVWLAVAFHTSNLVIGVADLAILALIIRGWRYKRDGVPTHRICSAVAFLPAMAGSRFARVLELAGAPYHLTTILDVMTAILSVYSASQYSPLINHILKLPSRTRVHDLNDRLQVEVSRGLNRELDLKLMNEALEAKIVEAQSKIERLEHDRISSNWWKAQKTALTEIQDQFQAITRKI